MNYSPTFFVNLLTYSDTKRALLGSRWRFHVNTDVSDEDCTLMENFNVLWSQNILTKECVGTVGIELTFEKVARN